MRKKLTQQYEVGGKNINNNELYTYNYIVVDQQAITDNPAYEEGMYYISLFILWYDYITVHRLEMRNRRVELESNPSYITVQSSRTRTADYENIITNN